MATQRKTLFLPTLIMLLAFAAWMAFQCMQLLRERGALATLYANQEAQVQDSRKLREGLDRVARETQLLADRGNQSAKFIVGELRKRGVTINVAAPAITFPAGVGAAQVTPK